MVSWYSFLNELMIDMVRPATIGQKKGEQTSSKKREKSEREDSLP